MSRTRLRTTTVLLSVLLAACGGGGSDSPSSTTSGDSTSPPQASDTTTTPASGTPTSSANTPPANTPPDNQSGNPNTPQPSPSNPQLAAARFYNPTGITFDAAGNLYVIDRTNIPDGVNSRGHDIVRKIAPDGSISNLGNTGYEFDGLAAGPGGDVYYAESRYDRVMKLAATGSASVFASSGGGGIAIEAGTFRPKALASDAHDNLYIADTGNHLIRKITPEGTITTVAGQTWPQGTPSRAIDGDAANARFARPQGIAVDAAGDVYVLDTLGEQYYDSDRDESVGALTLVRKITVSTGAVTTVAGLPRSLGQSDDRGQHGSWGPSDAAGLPPRFSNASGIEVDAAGNIYIADRGHSAVRKVTPDGTVSTIAGGGPSSPFRSLADLTVAANGDLYVTDIDRYVIYKVTLGGQISVFAGKEDDHGRVGFGS
jgi:sugar lactone lactonase YvrE